MHLLQFSHSIDSPSEIYVAFHWDLLLWPSLPPRQEGHSDTRVLGQMPSDSLWCSSTSKSHIHRPYRTISQELNEIPHTKPELPASPALLLAAFFFFPPISSTTASVNLWIKCSDEKKGKNKRDWRWTENERKKKTHTHTHTQVENKTTQLVHLCHWSHPVFLWGCVWTKRPLKLGYSTVLWHHYGHY